MIVAFSTSCPYASVAAISENGELLWSGSQHAPTSASAACMGLLERMVAEPGLQLENATLFLADIGPGSFTGVRVGVVLAKTFAYMNSCEVAGASSFDLIHPDETVVLPSKRGEFFIRKPGQLAIRSVELPELPYVGFGPGVEPAIYPSAAAFVSLLSKISPASAMQFVPEYLIEPSISVPKTPFKKIALGGEKV